MNDYFTAVGIYSLGMNFSLQAARFQVMSFRLGRNLSVLYRILSSFRRIPDKREDNIAEIFTPQQSIEEFFN